MDKRQAFYLRRPVPTITLPPELACLTAGCTMPKQFLDQTQKYVVTK